jgi:ankyrin repeat protein
LNKLFTAIRQGDFNTVKELLQKKPELISCTAKQPPKKDDGQSPLQVAIKAGHFEIAHYLLSLGADVNFIEADTCCNQWRAPVIHDAINAAIMCSRWNTNSNILGALKVYSTKEKSDEAFVLLQKIVQFGADVNAKDSFGNSCIDRACLQARQILPSYNHVEKRLSNDRLLTEELHEDLSRVFSLLIEKGANLNYISPLNGRTALEFYRDEPVLEFLHKK